MAGLSRASSGVPQGGSLTPFWKLSDTGVNRAFVLNPSMDDVITATQAQTFEKSGGPINASWTIIDNDVYKQLGPQVKTAGKVFLWVAVEEDGKMKPKVYQMTSAHFKAINDAVNEYGKPLQGLMLVVRKENNRWIVTAGDTPNKYKNVLAEIPSLWQEVVAMGLDGSLETPELFRMVSMYPSVEAEKEFLMKRCNVTTWNDVLAKFGQAPVAGGESQTDVDELE